MLFVLTSIHFHAIGTFCYLLCFCHANLAIFIFNFSAPFIAFCVYICNYVLAVSAILLFCYFTDACYLVIFYFTLILAIFAFFHPDACYFCDFAILLFLVSPRCLLFLLFCYFAIFLFIQIFAISAISAIFFAILLFFFSSDACYFCYFAIFLSSRCLLFLLFCYFAIFSLTQMLGISAIFFSILLFFFSPRCLPF